MVFFLCSIENYMIDFIHQRFLPKIQQKLLSHNVELRIKCNRTDIEMEG